MVKEFSIIIPVYNEEESLKELLSNIKKSFEPLKRRYEIIFVDDGSTDRSLEILKRLARENGTIKVCSFRKNLGKSLALMLGFQRASARYVVTLDADLQDDPKNIKSLQKKLEGDDLDLVSGWRKERRDTIFKVILSRFSNRIFSRVFGLEIHDINSGLKIMKADVAKDLKLYGGMHRFIPIIAHEMGYRVGEREVIHHARKYGTSKFKSTKIISELPDLITMYFLTKYTRRPLHFFGKIGSLVLLVGLAIILYLSYLHFLGQAIGRRPLLYFGIFLITAGIQTIFTGLLADLIVNLNYDHTDSYPIKYESRS